MRTGGRKFLLLISLILFLISTTFGQSIKFIEETPLDKGPVLAVDFCFHQDLLIIPDRRESDIKLYKFDQDKKKFILNNKIKNQHISAPTYCDLNNNNKYLAILNYDSRDIVLLDPHNDFSHLKTIPCPHLGYDLKLYNGQLFISGFTFDKYDYPFELYSIDLENHQKRYYIPAHLKYGFDSTEEYQHEYETNPEIRMMGIQGWFDIDNNGLLYYSWEASSLGLIKIDFSNSKIKPLNSMKKPSGYIKPHASNKLRECSFNSDPDGAKQEQRKMTYIMDVLSIKHGGVMIIFEGPGNHKNPKSRIGIYTKDGEFLKELNIPHNPGSIFYFDKVKHILYSLKSDDKNRESPSKILKYQIVF